MRPLLFLDIDDVLCIDDEFNSAQVMFCFKNGDLNWPELWNRVIDRCAAENLRLLDREFNPIYVISSSWASYLSRAQMSEIFARTGLDFVKENLHEAWRTLHSAEPSFDVVVQASPMNRFQELNAWLDRFRVCREPFIVIDDACSGASLINSQFDKARRVVFCEIKTGFTASKLEEARQVLSAQLAVTDFGIGRQSLVPIPPP